MQDHGLRTDRLGQVRGDAQLLPVVLVQDAGQEQQRRCVQGHDLEARLCGQTVDEVDVAGLGIVGDHDLDAVIAVLGGLSEGLGHGHRRDRGAGETDPDRVFGTVLSVVVVDLVLVEVLTVASEIGPR